jgi:hypothetical protein
VSATLQIGATTERTIVRGLQILAIGSPVPGSEAIVCDQGNVASASAVVPPPNALVDGVTIGSYEIGVRVMSAPPALGGCNLRLNGSTIQNGNVGVYAEGETALPVSVQLDGANTLQYLKITTGARWLNGGGLVAYSNVVGIGVRDNQMTNSDQGIYIEEDVTATVDVDIEHNTIAKMDNQGMQMLGPLSVTLIKNSVTGATSAEGSVYGGAVVLGAVSTASYPIVRARNNTLVGNGTAVVFGDSAGLLPSNLLVGTDFGTATDPGNNTFRCSSRPGGESVVSSLRSSAVGQAIPFEGNVCDHAPPVST